MPINAETPHFSFPLRALLFAPLLVLAMSTLEAAPAEAAEISVSSRIDAVTVFPRGAEVRRLGKAHLEPGDHTLVLTDLSAGAIPASIRVEGSATSKVEIGSVDSRRLGVPRTDTAATAGERRRLELEIERLEDEKAVVASEIEAAEAQRRLAANLTELPSRSPPAATGTSGAAMPDWPALFGLIGTRHAEAGKAILAGKVRQRELERQIEDVKKRLAALAPAVVQRTEVKVHVSAEAAGELDLVVLYQVEQAGWTPLYDARLGTGAANRPARLQLERRASIAQRSGEAWNDVALTLSTSRPSAGTAAPVLQSQLVEFQPEAPPPPPVRPASRPAGRGYASAPAPAAEGAADSAAAEPAPVRKVAMARRGASVEVAPFQALYRVPGRTSVAETGEAKRVAIDQLALEPQLVVRATPSLAATAYLYAKLELPAGAPLLAGRVALFRDGTFVGNGRLPLLAGGEKHDLGFGVDDAVKVRHTTLAEKRGETGLITSSRTDERNYRITVKSLHARPVQLAITDRVPVSLEQDLKVETTAKPQPTKRDPEERRGVLVWEMTLAPGEEKTIEHGWRAVWPASRQIRFH
jgi:uncharacterized protein (TIGR02231 family)